MTVPKLLEETRFVPEDAFLYAFDEAIAATADALRQAGVGDDLIWAALARSLEFVGACVGEIGPKSGDGILSIQPQTCDLRTLVAKSRRHRKSVRTPVAA